MESLMKNVESIPALFGATQNGGGKKKKKSLSKKKTKTVLKSKPKSKGNKILIRRQVFGIRYFGGEPDQFLCTKIGSSNAPAQPAQPAQPVAPVFKSGVPVASGPNTVQPAVQSMNTNVMPALTGGKKAKKVASAYKRYANMTVEKLIKIASKRGVKTTKKKQGKTVQVKKATLVRKLCELKYGK
jgi:hypothetical protein